MRMHCRRPVGSRSPNQKEKKIRATIIMDDNNAPGRTCRWMDARMDRCYSRPHEYVRFFFLPFFPIIGYNLPATGFTHGLFSEIER
ncbi:hypothetical protein VTN96DRAFT_1927 [Rasamsonia emersonii]